MTKRTRTLSIAPDAVQPGGTLSEKTRRPRDKIRDSVRFEVFKRDQFKCQYCGRCAPEVVLELDHIEPHSAGGPDDILNLVTACRDCNSGKSDRRLDDHSVLAKQRDQLEELAERREQLEMLVRWREGLVACDLDEVSVLAEAYKRRAPGWALSASGLNEARKMIRQYGLVVVLDAWERSADKYIAISNAGKAAKAGTQRAWRTAWIFCQPANVQAMYVVRAILRNKIGNGWRDQYEWQSMERLKAADAAGVPADRIRTVTLCMSRDCTLVDWTYEIDKLIGGVD